MPIIFTEQDVAWIPSGYCSQRECGHPPAAYPRKSDVAGQEGFPPCPESST